MTVEKTLIVKRNVKNSQDIVEWAKSQGLASMIDPSHLHVTICYSETAFDWTDIEPDTEELVVDPDDDRRIEMFGKDKNVLVIQFNSAALTERNTFFRENGASSNFPDYKAHITITYDGAALAEDHKEITPYAGEIIFDSERFEEIDDDWKGTTEEIDLTESFHHGFHTGQRSVEVFRNPSRKEYKACHSYDEVRAFVVGDDLLVWPVFAAMHQQVREALQLDNMAVPITITGEFGKDVYVMVTDNSSGRPFHHSGLAWTIVDSCAYLQDNFSSIEIGYYDEAIVGDWSEMDDEEDDCEYLTPDYIVEGARNKKNEIPKFWWYHPDDAKFIDCDDVEHAEYVEHHHRKMKLPIRDIAEIIDDGDAMGEFVDLAMEEGWIKGDERTITGTSVPLLLMTAAYYAEKWSGEPITIRMDGRWEAVIDALDIETLADELIPLDDLNESTEMANKKFWLVFDLPSEHQKDWRDTVFEGLGSGRMHGVRGISSSREIVGQWLGVARNAALVMDSDAVLEINDLKRIHYDDMDELLADNMAMLYRIWSKTQTKYGHHGLMQNLVQYMTSSLNGIDQKQSHYFSYYGLETRIGSFWEECAEAGETINNFDELCAWMDRAVEHVSNDNSTWRGHLKDIFADAGLSAPRRTALRQVARKISKIYGDEAEWVVRDGTFRIPKGSTLLILSDKETRDDYPLWKSGKIDLSGFFESSRLSRMKALDTLYGFISQYQLGARYNIRFIDSEKFNRVRTDVLDRRRKKS